MFKKKLIGIGIVLIMLISFGYSFLGMGSGSGDIDPMTQQMLLSQMMGQEFDFQSLLLSMVVAEASSIEAGGPCMDLGDFMDLFPQGKCGSTKAGTLYQVMKIGVLGECNGRVNAARSKFTGCVTKAEGELASCQGGCPGKCVKPCPKIPVDCPPGCTAICELECQNSFRETMQECEEDQRTDYKDAADMYEDEMKELGNKANMIRMIALANGMAQGTFDDEFTCEEILGSCIPSTDKIVGFGSLLACQDQPGLIMQVLNSAQGGEFGAAFNGGFDQAEFDKIIEMGNRDSARILFRELDDKNFGALSAEQMARGAQYGHIDKDQAGKITADQMSPELYQTLSNNELINEVPENELNTYLSAGGKKKPDPGKGKPGKGSGGSSGQGGQQQTGGMNPMVQNMLLSGIMGGGGKNAPQRPERDKDIRHPVVVQGPGCEPCSFPPGFNGFENGCHKCVKREEEREDAEQEINNVEEETIASSGNGGEITTRAIQEINYEEIDYDEIYVDTTQYEEKGTMFCHKNGACLFSKNFYDYGTDLMQFYLAGPSVHHRFDDCENLYIVEGQENQDLEDVDGLLYHIDNDGITEMLVTCEDGAIVEDENKNSIWLNSGHIIYAKDEHTPDLNYYKTNTDFFDLNSGVLLKPRKQNSEIPQVTGSAILGAVVGLTNDDNIKIRLGDIAPMESKSIGIINEDEEVLIFTNNINTKVELLGYKYEMQQEGEEEEPINCVFPIEIIGNKAYGNSDIVPCVYSLLYKDYYINDKYEIITDGDSTKVIVNGKIIQESSDWNVGKKNFNDYQANMMEYLKENLN